MESLLLAASLLVCFPQASSIVQHLNEYVAVFYKYRQTAAITNGVWETILPGVLGGWASHSISRWHVNMATLNMEVRETANMMKARGARPRPRQHSRATVQGPGPEYACTVNCQRLAPCRVRTRSLMAWTHRMCSENPGRLGAPRRPKDKTREMDDERRLRRGLVTEVCLEPAAGGGLMGGWADGQLGGSPP